jgi:hypothetical protein
VSLLIFISLATAANLFQKGYNYFVHGYFTQIPFVGLQLLTPQLYISEPSDIALLKEPEQINFLSKVYDYVEKQRLLIKNSRLYNVYYHYENSYNDILWGAIYTTYLREYSIKEMTVDNWIAFDKFTQKIAVILLKKNYKHYISLIKDNIFAGGRRFYYYYILILFGVVFSFYSYKATQNEIALFYLFATCLNVLNYMIVSLFQPLMERYSFYTEVIQFVALILLISPLMDKKIEHLNSKL